MPQQYPESETIDCITGAGYLEKSNFNPTNSELQMLQRKLEEPSKQNTQINCYIQQTIENSSTACYNNRLYLNDFCRNSFIWCSCDQINCSNSNENEYLNQACKFYVNSIISLNSNRHSFLVSC